MRKLWVYYSGLPAINLIAKSVLQLEDHEYQFMWGSLEPMIADLIDATNQNTYVLMQANSKQRVKQPKAYPRPDYAKNLRVKEDNTPKRNRLPGGVKYVPKKGPEAKGS